MTQQTHTARAQIIFIIHRLYREKEQHRHRTFIKPRYCEFHYEKTTPFLLPRAGSYMDFRVYDLASPPALGIYIHVRDDDDNGNGEDDSLDLRILFGFIPDNSDRRVALRITRLMGNRSSFPVCRSEV